MPYLVQKAWDVHILSGGTTGIEHKKGFTIYKPKKTLKIGSAAEYLFSPKQTSRFNFKDILMNSPRNWLRYIIYISLGRKIIRENNIRIISAYNLYSYGLIGAELSEEFGIPLVMTNFGEIYNMTNFFKKNKEMVKFICGVARKLLSCSRHCSESYKLLGLAPSVDVIPYGINIKSFSPTHDPVKIRKAIGLTEDDKVVLFVGRLVKDMGLQTLIEAIPKIVDENNSIKFLIVGQSGELLLALMELAKRFEKQVFVMTNVPLEELPLYYAASTIVVTPTSGDRACSSLAAMEAMATGRPVIASKIGGIPELVVDNETGILISPEKVSDLKKAVLSLLTDKSLIQQMGLKGRERAEAICDEETTNLKMERIFAGLSGI